MADLGEQVVAAAMARRLENEAADLLLDIHLRVVRTIQCPISGRVLDSRTAHLVTAATEAGSTGQVVVDPSVDESDLARALGEKGLTLKARFDPADMWRRVESGVSA